MKIQDLVKIIERVKGCTFAEIEYISEVKLNKGEITEIGGNVQKHVIGNVQLNYTYENAVNNRLEKQGGKRDFVAEKLPWGEWLSFNKIIAHKGEMYLRCYTHKGGKMNVTYIVDGVKASAEQTAKIKDILSKKTKAISKTQAEKGLTENQVEPKNIKFSNLIAVNCGELWRKDTIAKIEVA